MPSRTAFLMAATRQAMRIACALAGAATVASPQSTYRLRVSAVGFVAESGTFYRGTSQVTSVPSGIDCRSEIVGDVMPTGTCTSNFPAGTTVVLTATPLFDGTFDGWTGACAGQGTTCQLEMTMDRDVATKTIARTYTLTVRGNGNALGFVHSTDHFANPAISCTVRGSVTSGPCVAEYPAGQMVWLGREETVNTFAQFAGWLGCGPLSDDSNCRLLMDGPKTVTAGWIAPEIVIASSGGNGSGKVTGTAPPGTIGAFDCTITAAGASGDCSALWETGPTSITLTATPNANSVFLGWDSQWCSGTGPCSLSPATRLDQMRMEIRALFVTTSSTLTIAAAGSGSGTVGFSPARNDCIVAHGTANSDCSTTFPQGLQVTLTANPTGGSTFGGWSGACSGAELVCTLVASDATHVTVTFVAPRPVAELALALMGRLTISAAEQHELDRFGNTDNVFDLGDLLALLARTGERLSPSTMSALLAAPAVGIPMAAERRIP